MRQLLPAASLVPGPRAESGLADEVDPRLVYTADERPARPGRPWVVLNMIASADGAIAVDGRSGPLGGPTDRAVFHGLRAIADVILVGAETVRVERYGPHEPPATDQERRIARGQPPIARFAVPSASLDFDPTAPFFTQAEVRPIVFCPTDAQPARRRRLAPVADVVPVGEGRVALDRALAELWRRGARVVLCEGGPTLNGQLISLGLVDELCFTVAPWLVSGTAGRAAHGEAPPDGPTRLRLDRLLEADGGYLFVRYVRDDGG
ncbi:MAG: pyrimidine reductase family protein [Acidimicrobiales bacterium]